MAMIPCPECAGNLEGTGSHYTCPVCGVDYVVEFTCQECGESPEEISSCGSVGYFCNTCKALRSRTAMKKNIRKAP